MMSRTLKVSRLALAAAAGMACLFVSDNWSSTQRSGQTSLITQADARIGRPATPGSVAGVARRTGRRAVRRGAYIGAGAAAVGAGAAYYGSRGYYGSGGYYGTGYGSNCYQARNEFGRLVTVCP